MRMARWVGVLALLTGTARAEVLLGVQVERQSLDVRDSTNGVTAKNTLATDTAVGLVAGVGKPGGGDRVLLGYESYDLGGEGSVGNVAVAYHWFFPALLSTDALGFRPFVGGEVGYGWMDLSARPGLGSAHDNNVTYGARAGFNLAVSGQAEVELGARYSHMGLAADQYGAAGTARFAVDNAKGWWLGVNVGL